MNMKAMEKDLQNQEYISHIKAFTNTNETIVLDEISYSER